MVLKFSLCCADDDRANKKYIRISRVRSETRAKSMGDSSCSAATKTATTMPCVDCLCAEHPDCAYKNGEPCNNCIHGASGYHKRLCRQQRLDDDSELPDAEWDDAKIAEVTLDEAFEYFLRKLAENVRHCKTFDEYVSRFKAFYEDEIEAHLSDEIDDDDSEESELESCEINFATMKRAELLQYCRDNDIKNFRNKTRSHLIALCEKTQMEFHAADDKNTDCDVVPNVVGKINNLFVQLRKEIRNPEKLQKVIASLKSIHANKLG